MAEINDLMRTTATRFVAAHKEYERAEAEERAAKVRAERTRKARNDLELELGRFVGANVPRRVIRAGDDYVLVEQRGEFVSVSLPEVI